MILHKNTRLPPIVRKQVFEDYKNWARVTELVSKYNVSHVTIYKIINRARLKDFIPHKSINDRYRCLKWWLIRLAKIEDHVLKKKNAQARRYNKQYPWEMWHIDHSVLPAIKWDKKNEYLFVFIDDFSRELYANIYEDKTQVSATRFLQQVIEECPYKIERIMSDNGTEFKWNAYHTFVDECRRNGIKQVFTKVKHPRTNGKAERAVRTLMTMWHDKHQFTSSEQRKQTLKRFINRYNIVKPHKSLNNLTPYEFIANFYYWTPNL